MSAKAFLHSVFLFPCLMASGLAAASVSISPSTTQTINENATMQFKASVTSTWTASCGSISSAGLYRASLYPATCTITAKSTIDGSTASAKVTVVSPVTMSPVTPKTPQGQTQQFTSSAPVVWRAGCGSITTGGLYTASAAVGSYCTVEGTAASGTPYHVYGYDHILAPIISMTVSPASVTMSEGGTQQFTARATATWSASCGSVTSAGLYTAPLVAEACVVTAKPTAGGSSATAGVTVNSPITITPSSATTSQSSTQQFTANMPVNWAASCGTISSSGLFTASGTRGAVCSIQATAASGTAYTAMAKDTIGAPAAFTISPSSAAVSEASTQQFTASASATWSASCGSVTTAGLYTAPLLAGTCTVTATPTGGGTRAAAAVTVSSPITIAPSSALTAQNGTQQFSASAPVTWSASCGSISTSGLFTASGTPGSVCSIQATAASGTVYTATASDTIAALNAFTISPSSAALNEAATQQFLASASATWSASCGLVDGTGLYTAPLLAKACTVTATSTVDGSTALAAVTVNSPITITPASVNLHAMDAQTFTASQPVAWTTSCGTITSVGVFNAPTSAGNCSVTATASSGTAFTAVATANVDVVNYTAWKGGGGDTGAQTDELALTPANVNSSTFGVKWTASVDGVVSAQPLYMNALMINGVGHNVVFVATNNDSVYAFDGDTGAQLWRASLIPAGATAVAAASVQYGSTPTQLGVLGTPAIDPSTNTIYVVSETSEQNATYFPHRLHALDVTTGAEKFGGPVLISNPQMQLAHKLQRPGLLLANGSIYVGIGSMSDKPPFNGLLFAFSASTLAQQAVWVVTPTAIDGGIWMGGAAPSVDENGYIYVATGNGTFDGITNYGESAVKLSSGLQVQDYFAPHDYPALVANDLDLGSGDVMVVPDQVGAYPHELIVCGKPTPIYVLDRDNMGQVGTTSDNVIQRLDKVIGVPYPGWTLQSCLTAPAMWGQNVYIGGINDVLKMFTLNASTGMLSTTPVAKGTLVYGYPGADPVVSANGATNGIVWTIDTGTNTLRAYDAISVGNLLYAGSITTSAFRWTIPTVVNGHVYLTGQKTVFAFGLK